MQWPTVLVIILSALLIIMLLFCMAVVGLIIVILRRLNRMTRRAEEASENWSALLKSVGKKVGPAALSTLVAMAASRIKNKRKGSAHE